MTRDAVCRGVPSLSPLRTTRHDRGRASVLSVVQSLWGQGTWRLVSLIPRRSCRRARYVLPDVGEVFPCRERKTGRHLTDQCVVRHRYSGRNVLRVLFTEVDYYFQGVLLCSFRGRVVISLPQKLGLLNRVRQMHRLSLLAALVLRGARRSSHLTRPREHPGMRRKVSR